MSGDSYARRAVLRGAAGAGALGLVVASGVGTAVAAQAATAAPEQDQAPATDTPVVVYLRDAGSGELEIFAGTSRTEVHDPALAARLARAISVR